MNLPWRRARKPLTQEEAAARIEVLVARSKRRSELAEQKIGELLDDINHPGGPGGPDDSAGAVRVL